MIWKNTQDSLMQEKKASQLLKLKIRYHLDQIYKNKKNHKLSQTIFDIFFEKQNPIQPNPIDTKWGQEDVILITYANTFINQKKAPLKNLKNFLSKYIKKIINSVHILPFFPYSSDDGFAVIDFTKVNEGFGSWSDIERIAKKYKLMTDVVINHCSSRSQWFEQFKNNQKPGVNFFLELPKKTNTKKVIRPRTSDLLQEFNTASGKKYVWCTFGPDQPDLNYQNPEVMIEMLTIIKSYLDKGSQILRLDAIAFLWKDLNTNCINLNEAHEFVRLIRTLIDHYSDKAYLITETNIPNLENLSYFGNRNEAHLVYNFALPPLIMHSLLNNSSHKLKQWLMRMPPAMFGTTYLNFIASHDGIGLRSVENILEKSEIDALISNATKANGKISYRTRGHISEAYEINISLFDAFKYHIEDGLDRMQNQRFICAHTIMLAMEGIPAFYIHSLLATKNDYKKLLHTSQNRSINRHQWSVDDLEKKLSSRSHHKKIFFELLRLIEVRKKQRAFHPNATQFTLEINESIFGLWRQSLDREQSIFSIHNISNKIVTFNPSSLNMIETDSWYDLISGKSLKNLYQEIKLKPYQSMWLSNK